LSKTRIYRINTDLQKCWILEARAKNEIRVNPVLIRVLMFQG